MRDIDKSLDEQPSYMRRPVDWNFKAPVSYKNGVRFEPNFAPYLPLDDDRTESTFADRALRIARDCEVSSLLLEAGELTTEEDIAIEYTRAVPGQCVYVGAEDKAVFVAKYYNEEMMASMGKTYTDMTRLRELLSIRKEGAVDGTSKFEK